MKNMQKNMWEKCVQKNVQGLFTSRKKHVEGMSHQSDILHSLIFSGSSDVDVFLVTYFGRWWGAVRIHISHIQLPYTVINVWGINMWRGFHMQLMYMVINMCNIDGN